MANKAQNLLNSVKDNCTQSVYESVCGIFDGMEKATPVKQGKMIRSCLESLNEKQVNIQPIMRQCNCLASSVINDAKKCLSTSNGDIPKFLQLLNDQGIGGGQLQLNEDGNIIGIYSECYCNVPKEVSGIPVGYCECSAGWFEKLFENVFDKKVNVKIVHTILGGFPECIFEINYTKL
jgi:predicted hydrocarbon binding protein